MLQQFRLKKVSAKSKSPVTETFAPAYSSSSKPARPPAHSSPPAPKFDHRSAFALPSRANTGLTSEGGHGSKEEQVPEVTGLEVIYEPEVSPPLDIIFVHGIGGTLRSSWAKDQNPDKFWPLRWLTTEPGIRTARILSFGYNAIFGTCSQTPITDINLHARELLECMKAPLREADELPLGQRPILFVVHSAGGLVVKQAYLLGQNDERYRDIVASISAIVFLATPNRGDSMAEILDRILSVSIVDRLPGSHRADIHEGAQIIQALNDQFRQSAPRLSILSYYEEKQTPYGRSSMMVLDADSAKVNLPEEEVVPLEADHNSVCKFESARDSNYIHVRNGIKILIKNIRSKGPLFLSSKGREGIEQLENLLDTHESYKNDLQFFRKRWTDGTCGWILSHEVFERWKDENSRTAMLWLHALPASGKSVLSSFVIHHLQVDYFCVYYFFRFGDARKRSLSTCLRVLAFQIAERLPQFRRALYEMKHSAESLGKADARTIWDKVFVGILFRMRFTSTQYWIVDALDEADYPFMLVELMEDISQSLTPIKVLLLSRQTPELISSFEHVKITVPVVDLPLADTRRDIRNFLEKEARFLHVSATLRSHIVEKLVAGAESNFLWARLAFDEVKQCNTEEDFDDALRKIPSGMTGFYKLMEMTVSKYLERRPRGDRALGQAIMLWAVCSRRPLTITELIQALHPAKIFMDASIIIRRVCGQFLIVDSNDRLVMVHQTARDHILSTDWELAINETQGHETLFKKCLAALEIRFPRRDSEHRFDDRRGPDLSDFILYATTSWPYHLDRLSSESDEVLNVICDFLEAFSVLSWITTLARKEMLRVLVSASKSLSLYARRKKARWEDTNPAAHEWRKVETIELWAVDFLKLLGKFGDSLLASPDAIYDQIPPFCPKQSAIYKQFEQKNVRPYPLNVTGLTKDQWDDSLARMPVSTRRALKVVCSADTIAVYDEIGEISLYNAMTFHVRHKLTHTERVCAMCFSKSSTQLATYGHRTTKVWDIASGEMIHKISNPMGSRAFTLEFASADTELIAGSVDNAVRKASLSSTAPSWSLVSPGLLKDDTALDRPSLHKNAWRMAFDSGANYLAVAYRNFPLCVWSLDPPRPVGRCMRSKEYAGNSWTVVDHVTWHPGGEDIIGVYMGGQVFRWNPFDNTQRELEADGASHLACSPDGNFFATGDQHGTIKLFNFHHWSLIYQLSRDDMINDLTFAPDSKRLYDVRGTFCNAWEPNVLIRAGETPDGEGDVGSELASISTHAKSESSSAVREPITVIATQYRGHFHAIGNANGVINLVDSQDESRMEILLWVNPAHLSVTHLAWSGDGNYLVCADLSGIVAIRKVEQGVDMQWTTTPVFEKKLDAISTDGIQKIMLNDSGQKLFVHNGASVTVWTVAEPDAETNTVTAPLATWIQHPSDVYSLLSFTASGITVHRWNNLQEIAYVRLIGSAISPQSAYVQQILSSSPSPHLVMIAKTSPDNGDPQTRMFSLEIPSTDDLGLTPSLSALTNELPADVQDMVEIPLGLLPVQGFIFLDKNFWMCSYQLHAGAERPQVQRYYFLPRDWLNKNCVELGVLLANGAFLIPNNGELAVIQCSALR